MEIKTWQQRNFILDFVFQYINKLQMLILVRMIGYCFSLLTKDDIGPVTRVKHVSHAQQTF